MIGTKKQTNKEHNGRRVSRSRDHCCPDCPGALECTEQACIRTAPHADFATTSLPPHKHKNTNFPSLTVNEQIQAYHPTGVKNYILAALFFFFLSFLISGFFLEIKHTRLPLHRHNKTTSWPPHRHKRTSLYPHKLISPHAGLIQTYKLIATQAAKLRACCHIGIEENYKLTAIHWQKLKAFRHTGVTQNYKLAATS